MVEREEMQGEWAQHRLASLFKTFSPAPIILTRKIPGPCFWIHFDFCVFCFSVLAFLGCHMLSETFQTGQHGRGKPIIILCYCVACSHSLKSSQCLCSHLIGAPRICPLLLLLLIILLLHPLCNLCSFRGGGLNSLYSMLCY